MKPHVTSREEILEQAMQIAVREGVDQVSIRKLAKACNMAVGSMYNYYADKESLISEVAGQFWNQILMDQDKIYRKGMSFTMFLEQYYNVLFGRLSKYDNSWLKEIRGTLFEKEAKSLFKKVLLTDGQVNRAIWNMELNEDAFCEYVLVNILALLRAGEQNCRFFVFLLEHLLYEG